jgi:Ca2+-binding EF-hand superfamily protein
MFLFFAVNCFFASLAAHGTMHDRAHVQDKEHLKEHLQGVVDLDQASEDELRFHYFTSHDVEGNGKLDGCELVQSLLHLHSEESSTYGFDEKVFTDVELSMMVDHVLKTDDRNFDGFIDYSEFVAGQMSRGY